MIDTLYTVKDVCALFKLKDARTARKIMRQMDHTETPLLVTERAIKTWLQRNTLPPEGGVNVAGMGRTG